MEASARMTLGIDLGTSSVKAVLVDESGEVRASASSPLQVSHPHPRWSEQDPATWWTATEAAITEVLKGTDARRVAAIGLSGQMHGATLLDTSDRILRPAILWNDGRSDIECEELERVPGFRSITGNLAMPGFTAPKLAWVRKHERDVFDRVAKVLLPKDYLRLLLTGEYMTDASDAAGTLWLDVEKAPVERCHARRHWARPFAHAAGVRGQPACGTPAPGARRSLGHGYGAGRRGWWRQRRRRRWCGHRPPWAGHAVPWARRGCISPSPMGSVPVRSRRCTASATRCLTPGTSCR